MDEDVCELLRAILARLVSIDEKVSVVFAAMLEEGGDAEGETGVPAVNRG